MLFKIPKIECKIPISRSEMKIEARIEPPILFIKTDCGRRFLDKGAIFKAFRSLRCHRGTKIG